jgi:hypothetical protein
LVLRYHDRYGLSIEMLTNTGSSWRFPPVAALLNFNNSSSE